MRILTASQIARLLPHAACIELIDDTMRRVSAGGAVVPLRQFMPVPGTRGRLGLMPGFLSEPRSFGVKIVSKFERPPGSRHGSHVGAVMLFDADEGIPVALFEGGMLTAIRTAAASAVATRALARRDAATLLLCGTGEEAWHHALALRHVRDFRRVIVWGRTPANAAKLAQRLRAEIGLEAAAQPDLRVALGEADVACTVTSAREPWLRGEWLRPGVHVNLVGAAAAQFAEADVEVVARSRFYTDWRESLANQGGEWLAALQAGRVSQSHLVGEIGEVLAGTAPGRANDAEITVYKSLGISPQDLAAASFVYRRAVETGTGTVVDLDA